MSVIHKKSNGGASTEIEKEVREVKAAGEQTAALLALSFKAQIVQDRAAGTNTTNTPTITLTTPSAKSSSTTGGITRSKRRTRRTRRLIPLKPPSRTIA